MAAKILLISSVRWPSVARLAAGFARACCVVDALAPPEAAILVSRYLHRWHRYRPLFPVASLREAIARAEPDLAVCCDDRSVAQVLTLYERCGRDRSLARLIERSLGNPSAIPRLIARNGFMAEARAEGVRVPDTISVPDPGHLESAFDSLGFPLVLKSDGSWGGDGVVIARNPAEARAGFARLARPPSQLRSLARAVRRRDAHHLHDVISPVRREVSAQRFVAGFPAASAFAAWKGEIAGAIYYDVIHADGTIGPPNVIRRVDCPQIRDATARIARRFGLSGIHGMDFIRDPDGIVHLIEINPRATQGSTLAFGRGRDLPSALAGCLIPDAGVRPAIANDTVVFFPREWQRDPASPFLESGYHDVPWDDPAVLLATLGVPVRTLIRRERGCAHGPAKLVPAEPTRQPARTAKSGT